jgi:chromate reductase
VGSSQSPEKMSTPIRWAGICGSLRTGSYNAKLLKAITGMLPPDVEMDILSIAEIPLYNGDLDLPIADERPAVVTDFRDKLAACSGFVIVSPEYNYSIPGVLKNAIDWASRGKDSPLLRKPVAVFGTTPGMWGTARMQLAFLPVFQFLDMQPVFQPEVLIAKAEEKFNAEGQFTDEKGKEIIRRKLEALKKLTLRTTGS